MVNLKTSVRAADDPNFQQIQEIARMPLSMLLDETNDFVTNFLDLISSNYIFVDDWDDPRITEKTFRLYSKKVPAKEASKQYSEQVKICLNRDEYISITALDVEKPRLSHAEWYTASETIIDQIAFIQKEPTEIFFFRGGQYEFTYNMENVFSQSKMAILYNMHQEQLLL